MAAHVYDHDANELVELRCGQAHAARARVHCVDEVAGNALDERALAGGHRPSDALERRVRILQNVADAHGPIRRLSVEVASEGDSLERLHGHLDLLLTRDSLEVLAKGLRRERIR